MKDWLDQDKQLVDWSLVRGIIFDVDGTLYHQKPVRIRMAFRLTVHVLLHPRSFRDLMGIYYFRKLRETNLFRTQPLERQIQEAAARAGIQKDAHLREAIQLWMFDAPLPYIRKHENRDVTFLLKQMRSEGKKILIYSDYAPEQKLQALGISADGIYYPGTEGIEELKPSGKNIRIILTDHDLRPEETVLIGDRTEKDGESARAANVRFIPV